jgi:squalene-hopene/tetraprenyl-beta-curcumene cyclase
MESAWFEPSGRRVARRTHAAAASRQAMAEACTASLIRAQGALLELQKPEGFWCGDLLADTTLESDYILLQLWLHRPSEGGWNPPTMGRIGKAARSILDRQLPGGGYNIYPGGPADSSASVKAYTALKLAGVDPDCEPMRLLREKILELGGIQEANSYVKINLSLFGLYPRQHVPTIPPELVLLPGGVLYEMSSWTRAIVVPLSIVQSRGGVRPVPPGFNLHEIEAPGRSFSLPRRDRLSLIFYGIDRGLKIWHYRGNRKVKNAAIRAAEKWMLDHTRYSHGLGAIYPSMMYLIMALESLGYPEDHPDYVEAIQRFDDLMTEGEDSLYFQPCFSPVWDTAYAMFALGEAGQRAEEPLRKAADWLLAREVRRKGDWSVKRPDLEPSGWAFEYENEHYPDIDDTAMVLLALMHAKASDPAAQERCERRAMNWLLGMQSKDGGWAAFDVDNDWQLLNKVPFADHNAMLDPTCPDITGRVLEALMRRGLTAEHPAVAKGIDYLLKNQEEWGSWYGRWGVDYIYGAFLAVRALAQSRSSRVGESVTKASHWLAQVQNADGGWGESCESYAQSRFVAGPSTASQTAWALIGLLAGAPERHPEVVRKGLDYLLQTQKADGTWDEDLATGTGFPNVFYLRYTLYRNYFPVIALNMARKAYGVGTPVMLAAGADLALPKLS